MRTGFYILLLIAVCVQAGCVVAESPAALPLTSKAASESTSTPLPTQTPTVATTNTPEPRSIQNYYGEWEVYIQAPSVSIVKVITFSIDHPSNTVTAQWNEGTRTVYLEGVYDPESETIEGHFYNSDVDVFDFSLIFYPDEQVFRGLLFLPDMLQGLFCGARAGEPRPSPCRPTR